MLGYHAQAVAVDIGAVAIKGMASAVGGARRCIFPARLELGYRSVESGAPQPIYVTVNGAVVRVGDAASEPGFLETELPPALSGKEALSAFVGGVFAKLGVGSCDVLIVSSSRGDLPDLSDPSVVSGVLADTLLNSAEAISSGAIGSLSSVAALVADLQLSMRGDIATNAVPPDGFMTVVDCGALAWRYMRFDVSGVAPSTSGQIKVDLGVERAACELIEREFGTAVLGVAETMGSQVSMADGALRDVTVLIDRARSALWSKMATSFESSVLVGVKRLYVGGGHAAAVAVGLANTKYMDVRVAKQCETSIVRGLFKSGTFFGKRSGNLESGKKEGPRRDSAERAQKKSGAAASFTVDVSVQTLGVDLVKYLHGLPEGLQGPELARLSLLGFNQLRPAKRKKVVSAVGTLAVERIGRMIVWA